MKKFETNNAPAAIGPYSQAIITAPYMFVSGQIPVNPATGEVSGSQIKEQTIQSCENIKAILEEAGSSFSKVVKTTCFLADMKDFAGFNEVYAEYFIEKPARSCVAARELPKGVLCEIEVIAMA